MAVFHGQEDGPRHEHLLQFPDCGLLLAGSVDDRPTCQTMPLGESNIRCSTGCAQKSWILFCMTARVGNHDSEYIELARLRGW